MISMVAIHRVFQIIVWSLLGGLEMILRGSTRSVDSI